MEKKFEALETILLIVIVVLLGSYIVIQYNRMTLEEALNQRIAILDEKIEIFGTFIENLECK